MLFEPLCKTLIERVVIEMSSQLDRLAAGVKFLVDRALNPSVTDLHESAKPRGVAAAAPDPTTIEMIASTHEAQCDIKRWICYEGQDFGLQGCGYTLIRVDHQHPGVL